MKRQSVVCVVNLPGDKNYAVVYPGNILFGLNASETELASLIEEAERDNTKRRNRCGSRKGGSSLGIIVTFDCNLLCQYCYARGGESKEVIPLVVAKAALDSERQAGNENFLNLFLVGGGEPLLHFERVLEIVQYAKTLFRRVQINVVSNGTFGVDVRDWLVENNADVRISYDGVRHDIQRPFSDGNPSARTVRENIKSLVFAGIDVTVQCIVTAGGIAFVTETLDEVVSLGVSAIKIEPALVTDVSRASANLEPKPKEFAQVLLTAIRHIAEKGYELTLDTGFFAEPSSDFYCGMPNSNRVITPHGLITACVEVARPSDPYAEQVIFGRVGGNVVLDARKQSELGRLHFKNQLGGCSECNLRQICHGGCPMANIWKGGLPIRKSPFTCVLEHAFLPELLLLLATDDRIAKIVMEGEVYRF